MTDALLPESFDDFRSVTFWDGFFKERGKQAFEWYGDWRQLKPLLKRDCCPGKETLVLGCGNSELSADLYDSGCQDITNIDFSKLVIAAMMRKNLRQRPKMKWKVADMTAMQFPEASFQVALDKGGLDALMGEESRESLIAGQKLLDGISRVLCPGGVYLCITLAQSHVLRLLLEHFRRGWLLEVHSVPPSPDMARSPLQPVFIRAEKASPGKDPTGSNVCSIVRSPKAPNAQQLEEICQILEEAAQAALEETKGQQDKLSPPREQEFDELNPGSRRVVGLPRNQGKPGTTNSERFTAVILDVEGSVADAAIQSCCVFLVPQGRESEWLFASEEGQWQVASQCRCRRVILVLLSRYHQFSTSAAVQTELSPLVEPLAPEEVRGVKGAIPIMTTQEGVGQRRIAAEALSPISGKIVVEDVAVDAEGSTSYVRRMVFVENSNLIQSEARLVQSSTSSSTASATTSKKTQKKNQSSKAAAFPQLELDHSELCMEYHKHIVAGILACGQAQDLEGLKSLVVGLGGGGLPVFMSRYLGLGTAVVELDEKVGSLAEAHFGCATSNRLQISMGDGLETVKQYSPESLDYLVVDAGSNDTSVAVSCPPPAFLESEFLSQAAAVLKTGGLLIVNCVTRSQAAFDSALKRIQVPFCEVKYSELEDDINKVIFAAKKPVFHNWSSCLSPKNVAKSCAERMGEKQKQALAEELSTIQLNSLQL